MFDSVNNRSKDSEYDRRSIESLSDSSTIDSDATPGYIKTLSQDVLSRTSTTDSEMSLEGRVSPFSVRGKAPDDPREPTRRAKVEAQHVDKWKHSLSMTQREVMDQMELEHAGFWTRIRYAIIRWLVAYFKPDRLPEAQVQQGLYDIFSDILLKMKEQGPLQSTMVLEDLKDACVEAFNKINLENEEEKKRYLEYFDKQLRSFLQKHGAELIEQCGPDYVLAAEKNLVGLATSLGVAVRQGLRDEPDTQGAETIDLRQIYHVRSELQRYVVRSNGGVEACKGDYVLRKDEYSFCANRSCNVDILRNGAQINGKIYFSLTEVVDALEKLGVERKDLGAMVSFFAQNTLSTPLVMTTLVYGLQDPDILDQGMALNGNNTRLCLEIDPESKKYTLFQHNIMSGFCVGSSLEGIDPLYQHDELKQYDTFVFDMVMAGTVGETKARYEYSGYHLFPTMLEKRHPEMASLRAASRYMNGEKRLAFREEEIEILKAEIKHIQKLSITISHMKHLARSVSGITLDERGHTHTVSRGGKRLRGRRISKLQQIEEALRRLNYLQRNFRTPDGKTLEGTTLEQMEKFVQESEAKFTAVERLTALELDKTPDHPLFLWAEQLLEQHYQTRR
jgi:hypothetical protein